jgi:capsular polysaccharide biosynthesis protein
VVDIVGYLARLRRYAVPALLVAALVFAGAFLLSGRTVETSGTIVDTRIAVLPPAGKAADVALTDVRVAAASYAATLDSTPLLVQVAAEPGRNWTPSRVQGAMTRVLLTDSLLIDLHVQSSSIEDGIAMSRALVAALEDQAPKQLGLTLAGAAPEVRVVFGPERALAPAATSRSSLQSTILAGFGAAVAGFLVAAGLAAWSDRRKVTR